MARFGKQNSNCCVFACMPSIFGNGNRYENCIRTNIIMQMLHCMYVNRTVAGEKHRSEMVYTILSLFSTKSSIFFAQKF